MDFVWGAFNMHVRVFFLYSHPAGYNSYAVFVRLKISELHLDIISMILSSSSSIQLMPLL